MTREQQRSGPIRAGAAQVDITPQGSVHLAGAVGVYRPAQWVLDPLYTKALVLECGSRKLCFVALDLTIVTRRYSSEIRQAAAEACGFDPDAVMVHATQTHSAPSLGHFMLDEDFEGISPEHEWLRGGEGSYYAFAVERIIEAIRAANDALQPVQIGVRSGIEGRMAFNRRAVMRDGSVGMPGRRWKAPLGPTEIRYIEGPIDPELGVMCLRTDALRFPAMLVNYTCHPVHVFPKRIVSADWPGALADALRKTYSEECVPIVLNGACGNINPWPPFDPDYADDHRVMGEVLAHMAGKVVETMTFKEKGVLDWRVKHLPIPIRAIPPEELEEARKMLTEHPKPLWTDETRTQVDGRWMRAAQVFSVHLMRERERNLDYEIQVFRVGDVAFVGLPGEPFVEGGLRIKLASPAYPTYVVHDVNQYVGYLPIKEAFERGGHEVGPSYWAKLVPEALDRIVEAATELLEEVFQP